MIKDYPASPVPLASSHCKHTSSNMDEKHETRYVETLQLHTSHAEGHLEKRFSKLTMTGMAFAILKYVRHHVHDAQTAINADMPAAPGSHSQVPWPSYFPQEVQWPLSTASSSACSATSALLQVWARWPLCGRPRAGESHETLGEYCLVQNNSILAATDAAYRQYHWAYAIAAPSWKNSMVGSSFSDRCHILLTR